MTAEAREKIAKEHLAAAVSMKKAAKEAKEATESEVAQLQAQVEELRAATTRCEEGWEAEKKNIAIVLAASNKRA